MQRSQSKSKKKLDDLFFDTYWSNVLPKDPRRGRYVLLLSLGLQALIIMFGFLSHHEKQSDFDCCNAWALVVSIFFLVLQYPYYTDWVSSLGSQALWHRANMFAPYIIACIVFCMWLGGFVSMEAHVIGKEFFTVNLDIFTSLEYISFVVITGSVVPIIWLLIVIAHAHRNNLGLHYYAPGEVPNALTLLFDKPFPTEGSFNYRNMLGVMSRVWGVETSLVAHKRLRRIMFICVILQAGFYSFCGAIYHENKAVMLIIMVCLGGAVTLAQAQFLFNTLNNDVIHTRKWNRSNLILPLQAMILVVASYFVAISNMFFQRSNGVNYEDIIPNSSGVEKFFFSISLIILLAFFVVQTVLVNIHRKAWAEGTQHVNDGLDYTKALDLAHQQPSRDQVGYGGNEEEYSQEDEVSEYDDDPQYRQQRRSNV